MKLVRLAEVKEMAARLGLKTDRMKKFEIVRAIQEAEGNSPCFDSGESVECGQTHCLWRADCK